jgi:aldose 1-epimerase
MAGAPDVTPPQRDLRIVTLRAAGGGLEARFAVGAAMVGCSLRHRGEELLGILGGVEAYLARGKTFGLPLLYPWANRLGGWRYEVAGRTVEIDRSSPLVRDDGTEPGLPIHGALPSGLHWQLTASSGDRLTAELDWSGRPELLALFPFPHRAGLDVRLDDDGLLVRTTVEATADVAVPLSFGFHPYLVPPGAPRSHWEVDLPALVHLPLDDRGLPTGAREPRAAERFVLGDRTYDDLFAVDALPARFAVSDGDRRLAIELEDGFPYAQVFAPPARAVISFEPMAAPVDALRTHDGLRCVAPGERGEAAFALRVEAA